MATYIEAKDLPFDKQLNTFCIGAPGVQKELDLDDTKIANLQASNTLVAFVEQQAEDAENYFHGVIKYKNLLRYGNGTEVLGPLLAPPVYPDPLPEVTTANVQGQFADLIQDCVRSGNYTVNIGESLGIVKPTTVFEPQAGAPMLKVSLAAGGHPLLHVKIGQYDGFQIWKDSGDGNGYVLLNLSVRPDFLDLSTLPLAGASATCKFKAIYVYQNQQAGAWSSEVVITVYGNV